MLCGFSGVKKFLAALSMAGLSVVTASCGDDPATPAGPTPIATPPPAPSPTPTPPPAPPPAPAAPATLEALTISPPFVERQTSSTGTVRLTAGAPTGGAVITIESGNREVAKVPATVTVPAGATTATFTIETATVLSTTPVTIAARYLAVNTTAVLTVMPTVARAFFTVTSSSQGADACRLSENAQSFDCQLDGSTSEGLLRTWIWTLTIGTGRITEVRNFPIISPDTQGAGCKFVADGPTAVDAAGRRYVEMSIELIVEDREGLRSQPRTRAVRLYPDSQCNYTF